MAAMEEDETHLAKQEEFKIRYYKAVEWSTKILLKEVGSMVRDTFKVLGFPSPQDYCQRKLGWSHSETETFLNHREIEYLTDSDANTEYKLLTKVWKEVGNNVVQKVEAQKLLLQKAIYDPPVDLNEELLHRQIKNLFRQEEDLTDAVRKACHTLLEEERQSLLMPRKRAAASFKKIVHLDEYLCFLSLKIAIDFIRLICEETSFMSDQSIPEYIQYIAPDFDSLYQEVSSYRDQSKITEPLLNIDKLYIKMIQRSLLLDITDALNTIATGEIGHHLLYNWLQELQDLQRNYEGRLTALGRSECSSYKAAFGAPLVDVHRWLLTRNREPLKVNKTSWSLMELATGREIILQHLIKDNHEARVVIVYGPAGSGKTWLCHHLQEEWCAGHSSLQFTRDLQLVVLLKEENIRDKSFSYHLKNVMHPRVFAEIPDSQVIKSLCPFRVCFLMDASAGCKPEFTSAVSEVMRHLGRNIAIITTRPEAKRDVRSATANFQTDEVYLQPLGDSQCKDLCLDYLNILNAAGDKTARPWREELDSSVHNGILKSSSEGACVFQDPNMAVEKFLQTLGSEERKDLFYPLPLAYLLWLWRQNPKHLTKVTTVSKLFIKVISVCEQMCANTPKFCSLTVKVKETNGKEAVRKLASCASEVFTSKTFPVTSSWKKEDLLEFMKLRNSLYPFLGHFIDHQTKPKWRFLHPFLVEVLWAWDTYRKNADRSWRGKIVPHWNQTENSGSKGNKYITVTRLLSGFLCSEKDRAIQGSSIVKLFKCTGVVDNDFPTWASLLREGAWVMPLKKAVRNVMKSWKSSWKVCHASPLEVEAVVQLVTHCVYRPREVIIETKAPEEVIHMLANQSSIDVIILQVVQESQPRDSLLYDLKDAGNVIEFKGNIGEKGASVLARMTRLRILDIHLTSLAAVIAFSVSVARLSALCVLHLHLDIDKSIPVKKISDVTVPRCVNVYLNLYNIKDNNCKWAVDVAMKVKCCRMDVYLKKSSLSPDKLQYIKHKLHPTHVHFSK